MVTFNFTNPEAKIFCAHKNSEVPPLVYSSSTLVLEFNNNYNPDKVSLGMSPALKIFKVVDLNFSSTLLDF